MEYVNILSLNNKEKKDFIISFSKKQDKHEFGCLMFELPKDISNEIKEICKKNIADEILYFEKGDKEGYGRETIIHTTVKFGFNRDDSKELKEFVKEIPRFEIKLGEVSLFENKKEGYDVVKVGVISRDLHRINKKISEMFDVTDTHKEYKPHITLCYIKHGKCPESFLDEFKLTDKKIIVSEFVFSDKSDKRTKMKLK